MGLDRRDHPAGGPLVKDSPKFWAREYLCEPPPRTEAYRRAYILWCVAHALMERKDRTYCTGTGHEGEALPLTGWERDAVNRTGRRMSKALRRLAERFPAEDWKAAKRDAERTSLRERERIAQDHSDVVAEVRAAYAVFSEGYPV